MAIDHVYFSLNCWNAINLDILSDYRPNPALGLSVTEAKALYAVAQNQGMLMSYYAKQLRLKNGSFSTVIAKLEDKKLVQTAADASDKRTKTAYLTWEGKVYADAIGDGLSDCIRQKLGALSDAEKKTFVESLSALERLCIKYDL